MNSALKLTRQGVRDLDFGWKKKPSVPAAQDVALGAVDDANLGLVAVDEPVTGALVDATDHNSAS